jgi:hypothetical protein
MPRGHHTEHDPGRRVDETSHTDRALAEAGYPFDAHIGCQSCGTARTATVQHPADEFYCRNCGDRMSGLGKAGPGDA